MAEPRVARVAYVEGDASYLNAAADEWAPVAVNAPLVTGDRFYSGPGGRAEIELPHGVDASLSSATELDLLEVSSQAVEARLGVGTATFRVRDVPARVHVELSTPAVALVARSRGVYRVDVAEDGSTTVLVRDGEADAFAGDQRYRLERGHGARIAVADAAGQAAPIEVFDASRMPEDGWDRWEQQRADRLLHAASARYVAPDVYGLDDLDQYGSWSQDPSYGPVWRPAQVAADWAPYTQGRWVWQDPWGWTWVDDAPWGWAPTHYGRWVYAQDAWGWAPGPVVAQPVYAPATVGFVGLDVETPGVSVSLGIGPSIGWVPLGYGEPIIPWWSGVGGCRIGHPWWGGWGGPRIVNDRVIRRTSITNIDVTNIHYANFGRPHGFTAVSRESFVRGDLKRIDLPRERARALAHPLRGAPDVIPRRESLFATHPGKLHGGSTPRPPREVLRRASLSTRALPAPAPSFAERVKLIERAKGAPVAPRELARLAPAKHGEQPPVRTVDARHEPAVVPPVTARAPRQLDAPIERAAHGAAPLERAIASAPGRGARAAPGAIPRTEVERRAESGAVVARPAPAPGSGRAAAARGSGRAPRELTAPPQGSDAQTAPAEVGRRQERQAERARQDEASRRQPAGAQRAQTQGALRQAQQAERARRDAAARQQRAGMQRSQPQQAQAQHVQERQVQAQRAQAAAARREAAPRRQAPARAQARQQPRRPPPRAQAVARPRTAPAPADQREASRKEHGKTPRQHDRPGG